jgi:endoglucanase
MTQGAFSQRKTAGSVFILLGVALLGSHHLYAQDAVGVMRDITAKQVVYDMKIGWNLGNTMDASPGETGWGSPVTTQEMIDAVKAMGFKTVRIPVTWNSHIGPAPDYTIDKAWLDRVEAIVNYVLKDGMYAIVNTHHDGWIRLTTAGQEQGIAEAAKVWAQIATRFKDYSDYLILETFNEPKQSVNQYTGGTPEARAILNAYHLASVNAIRATGGNSDKRFIMCCTHAATPSDAAINDLVIPNNDPRIIVSIHTYYPGGLSFGNQNSWGTDADKAAMRRELDREAKDVASKGSGAAVIGEWGSVSRVDLASRVAHAEYYAQQARLRGMTSIWWDNGGRDFGILDRRASPVSWTWPTIAQALVRGAESASEPPKEDKTKSPPKELTVDLGGGVKLEMVLIPAGEFMMGSPDSDKSAASDEKPQHRVRITKPFYLGKYPVTQEQWTALMGDNPSYFKGPKNPVEEVSWDDCLQFLRRLNEKAGGGTWQFPTEAQWEYACRAGSTTKYCFGDDESGLGEYGWYDKNSGGKPHSVGEKKPNAWGLYDMHGNIWQWCEDWYDSGYYAHSPTDDPAGPATGSERVSHGGCWFSPARSARSANHGRIEPEHRGSHLGFRVSLAPADK